MGELTLPSYDVVIATRNRAAALALSVPQLMRQTVRPGKIIVADSSDDHDEIVRVVTEAVNSAGAGTPVELEIEHCAMGLPKQRNAGLARVTADVVIYPDDDSLLEVDAAEHMLRCYALDEAGDVGAVCSAEGLQPPEGVLETVEKPSYEVRPSDKLKLAVQKRRSQIERAVCPDPFVLHGTSRWGVRPRPEWLGAENAVLVEWMTGFRMSFRTDVIRSVGFDERLQAYAVFEDVDASFGVMRDKLIVGARNARIYHHKFPSGRGNGRFLGSMQLLNRAYVTCKHSGPGSDARRMLPRFSRFKALQYLGGMRSSFGRDRLAGARAAMPGVLAMMKAGPDELGAIYEREVARVLEAKR